MPVPGSLADHYSVPPDTYWTDDYFTLHENDLIVEIGRAKDLLARASFDGYPLALDVGAGIGKSMIPLIVRVLMLGALNHRQPFVAWRSSVWGLPLTGFSSQVLRRLIGLRIACTHHLRGSP